MTPPNEAARQRAEDAALREIEALPADECPDTVWGCITLAAAIYRRHLAAEQA